MRFHRLMQKIRLFCSLTLYGQVPHTCSSFVLLPASYKRDHIKVTNILDLKETNAFNNLFLRKKPKLCDYGREQDIMFYFFQKKPSSIYTFYLQLTMVFKNCARKIKIEWLFTEVSLACWHKERSKPRH